MTNLSHLIRFAVGFVAMFFLLLPSSCKSYDNDIFYMQLNTEKTSEAIIKNQERINYLNNFIFELNSNVFYYMPQAYPEADYQAQHAMYILKDALSEHEDFLSSEDLIIVIDLLNATTEEYCNSYEIEIKANLLPTE